MVDVETNSLFHGAWQFRAVPLVDQVAGVGADRRCVGLIGKVGCEPSTVPHARHGWVRPFGQEARPQSTEICEASAVRGMGCGRRMSSQWWGGLQALFGAFVACSSDLVLVSQIH